MVGEICCFLFCNIFWEYFIFYSIVVSFKYELCMDEMCIVLATSTVSWNLGVSLWWQIALDTLEWFVFDSKAESRIQLQEHIKRFRMH
jgi:hypothetical protein